MQPQQTSILPVYEKKSLNDNLVTQAVYRIIFCCVSGLAVLLSFGFFIGVYGSTEFTISKTFWQFYTNLSNYYCFGVGVAVCASTIKKVRGGQTRGHNTCIPTLKFCGVVMIMVTFFVYMILLGDVTSITYWNSIGNLSYHVAAPVLFIVDFIVFDEHKQLSVVDPLKTLIMPLIYVVYILIYGAICRSIGAEFDYPYFFLNVDELGYGGVVGWVAILLVIFLVIGYLLFVYDKLIKVDGKWKFDFSGTGFLKNK